MDASRESWRRRLGLEVDEGLDASALGDDFRSYLSNLEQEIRGREEETSLRSRGEVFGAKDDMQGGGTAAKAAVYAAQLFAETEDGSSGRTSARCDISILSLAA